MRKLYGSGVHILRGSNIRYDFTNSSSINPLNVSDSDATILLEIISQGKPLIKEVIQEKDVIKVEVIEKEIKPIPKVVKKSEDNEATTKKRNLLGIFRISP